MDDRGVTGLGRAGAGHVPFALVLGAQASRKGIITVEIPLMAGFNFDGGYGFAMTQLWTSCSAHRLRGWGRGS